MIVDRDAGNAASWPSMPPSLPTIHILMASDRGGEPWIIGVYSTPERAASAARRLADSFVARFRGDRAPDYHVESYPVDPSDSP